MKDSKEKTEQTSAPNLLYKSVTKDVRLHSMADHGELNLISEYRACEAIHSNNDFSNGFAVSKANAAADRMREIASIIVNLPEERSAFEELVWDSNSNLAKWAAHHVLELMCPSNLVRDKAIEAIEAASLGDSAEAYGERLWLNAWRSSHAT